MLTNLARRDFCFVYYLYIWTCDIGTPNRNLCVYFICMYVRVHVIANKNYIMTYF